MRSPMAREAFVCAPVTPSISGSISTTWRAPSAATCDLPSRLLAALSTASSNGRIGGGAGGGAVGGGTAVVAMLAAESLPLAVSPGGLAQPPSSTLASSQAAGMWIRFVIICTPSGRTRNPRARGSRRAAYVAASRCSAHGLPRQAEARPPALRPWAARWRVAAASPQGWPQARQQAPWRAPDRPARPPWRLARGCAPRRLARRRLAGRRARQRLG